MSDVCIPMAKGNARTGTPAGCPTGKETGYRPRRVRSFLPPPVATRPWFPFFPPLSPPLLFLLSPLSSILQTYHQQRTSLQLAACSREKKKKKTHTGDARDTHLPNKHKESPPRHLTRALTGKRNWEGSPRGKTSRFFRKAISFSCVVLRGSEVVRIIQVSKELWYQRLRQDLPRPTMPFPRCNSSSWVRCHNLQKLCLF